MVYGPKESKSRVELERNPRTGRCLAGSLSPLPPLPVALGPGLPGSPHHRLWNGLCPSGHLHAFLPFLSPWVRQDVIVIRAELVRVWDLHGCDQVCPENLVGTRVERVVSDCFWVVCSTRQRRKRQTQLLSQKATQMYYVQ